uniref:Uncharacterized protein n=1 Tax=Ciona intestinalis TaxID=7719 RepID=H2XU94_CIOIN
MFIFVQPRNVSYFYKGLTITATKEYYKSMVYRMSRQWVILILSDLKCHLRC